MTFSCRRESYKRASSGSHQETEAADPGSRGSLSGNLTQLTTEADAIFLLSLISGRNPELLIGNHVIAAPVLKDMREKVIPVGYMLVDCGGGTSVEYMSQTLPIPPGKNDIAVATAVAGEMLGMKAIYLEGAAVP